MTITKDQAQMLATLAAACRPNGAKRWDTAGIMAAIAQVRDRSLAEVVLATIRAAADRNADTPGVIPAAGDHWQEQLKPQPYRPETAPTGTRCTVCGQTSGQHWTSEATDHAFRRPRETDAATYAEHVAELRRRIFAETAGGNDGHPISHTDTEGDAE